MAFVNELIGDEDKRRIDWAKFRAWPFTQPVSPWKWTIDRERDVFLIPLGGRGPDGERPEVFALVWKGQMVRFEASATGEGSGKFWSTLHWKVGNVSVPEMLQSCRTQVIELVVQSLSAHGRFFSTEHLHSVKVDVA